MAKKKEKRYEWILASTDRKSAQKLRGALLKVLAKDKKSDGLHFLYLYNPFRKQADYLLEGSPKTMKSCKKAYQKFEKNAKKAEEKKLKKAEKAAALPKGKPYSYKKASERMEKHDAE